VKISKFPSSDPIIQRIYNWMMENKYNEIDDVMEAHRIRRRYFFEQGVFWYVPEELYVQVAIGFDVEIALQNTLIEIGRTQKMAC